MIYEKASTRPNQHVVAAYSNPLAFKNMKNKKIIIISLLTLCLGLIFGGIGGLYLGYQKGTEMGLKMGDFSRWGGMANYATVTQQRYESGNYEEAKAALIEFIEYWESFHGNEGEVFPKNAYEWDTAIAYGRLALLEENQGNLEKKNEYIEMAKERLKAATKQTYTEEKFLKFIRNLKEKG